MVKNADFWQYNPNCRADAANSYWDCTVNNFGPGGQNGIDPVSDENHSDGEIQLPIISKACICVSEEFFENLYLTFNFHVGQLGEFRCVMAQISRTPQFTS